MRAFVRDGDGVTAELEEFEVALLTSLIEQFQQVLGGSDTEDFSGLDAFERLAAEQTAQVELDHDDPLIERLFPTAYPDNPARAAEYRRFTEDDARRARLGAAKTVLDDLAATAEGAQPLVVPGDHTDAWLKTLNAVRLSLSVRLGITDGASLDALERLPARDPRTHLLDIYDWLGFALESLVTSVSRWSWEESLD